MIGDRMISDVINAELVVADLTDLNPSAFYEQCVLGLTVNVLEVCWWRQTAARSYFREPLTGVIVGARPALGSSGRCVLLADSRCLSRERIS